MIAAAVIGVTGLIAIIGGAVAVTQVPVRSGDVAGATGASSPTTSPASPAPTPRLVAVPTAPTGTGFVVDVAEQAIVTWTDAFGQVRVEVIVAVENRGSVAAMLAAGETDYTILSPTGQTAASGRFSRAFPPVVQPGQRAYLIDALAATFVDETELAKLEVKVRAVPATTTDVVMLTVDAVRMSTEGGTVAVSGVVKSAAQATAGPVTVVAILRDAAGKILCGLYDVGDGGAVEAGGSTSFSTSYPDAPPLDPAAVDAAEVFAFVDPVQVAEAAR